MQFKTIYGVDFSGAKLAGRNIWIARCRPGRGRRLVLGSLDSLEQLCGSAERGPALDHLVELIAGSHNALWGMDFPFGLPIEVLDHGCSWQQQLKLVTSWPEGAYELGLWCVDRAKKLGGAMHVRRTTDVDARTPFDCYHYRIIYQTYHGMRDVLGRLVGRNGTAVLPFQYAKLTKADRVVVESCPGSTLKRLGLPHQNYKQPTGGPLSSKRLRTRSRILEQLSDHVAIPPRLRRVMMRNPGGDAIDAVLAAVGAHQSMATVDHDLIARHPRYRREGHLYV